MKKIKLFVLCIMTFALSVLYTPFIFAAEKDDIVILYENDVHCNAEGYAKLSALKNELSEVYENVAVVSSGDFIQGESIGAISKGEYIIDIMNAVGYDAVGLGNHEFDYKSENLFKLAEKMDCKPVSSNFISVIDGKSVFEPFRIVSYGDTDIAYIGVITPSTLTSSSPAQFYDEKGALKYSFSSENLYTTVQKCINKAKSEGAEYVIVLAHLGTEDVKEEWSSVSLAENTMGIDAILDAHSHSVIESMKIEDKSGKDVIITSTGTKFENIGKMTISDDEITTELVKTEEYDKSDEKIKRLIMAIEEEYSEYGERKIGYSEVFLTTEDENGKRIIRNNHSNIGDFITDAYMSFYDADIAFTNGGGIRNNIEIGDITYNDILSVLPFGNEICVAEVTGRQIADMLELGVRNMPFEDGSLQHVSGMKYSVNISIPTGVITDENDVFKEVEGQRRVFEIMIKNKESGEYEPIVFEKKYTLISTNYLLEEQGGGASMFSKENIIFNNGDIDIDIVEKYITEDLGGVIGKEYEICQNNINIVEEETVENNRFHIVEEGDNLWNLAIRYNTSVDKIANNNMGLIKDKNLIIVGWKIRI